MDSTADVFEHTLVEALARWDVSPSAEQLEKFGTHYQMLVEANRSFNLTRIVEPADAAIKHFADSLSVVSWLKEHPRRVTSMLDIGTGAGFPALPLAVMFPKWRVTAIDGTQKKVGFVSRVARATGLSKVEAVHAHSAHWKSAQKFDLVVLRAVAALDACVTLACRFVAAGGAIVAYKSTGIDEPELESAARTAIEFGLKAMQPYVYELDGSDQPMERNLYLFGAGKGAP